MKIKFVSIVMAKKLKTYMSMLIYSEKGERKISVLENVVKMTKKLYKIHTYKKQWKDKKTPIKM